LTDRDLTALTTVPADDQFAIERWQFDPNSFTLTGSGQPPAFDEWERIGQFIRLTNHACQWWWGDWINYGDLVFGEASAQAVEATGWEPDTVRNYAWVAARVPRQNRDARLRFGMYQLLAKLGPDEQAVWVERCLENGWTRDELRKALHGHDTDVEMQYFVKVWCRDEAEQHECQERFASEGLQVEIGAAKKKG